jgi:hypothetical protein
MCWKINISTAQNAMTVLMYLYSRLHMHRTVHGKLKVSILFGKGNRGWKFLRAGLNPYCLGLGGLKRLNLVSKNREFNSLLNETEFSLFCVLHVVPCPSELEPIQCWTTTSLKSPSWYPLHCRLCELHFSTYWNSNLGLNQATSWL